MERQWSDNERQWSDNERQWSDNGRQWSDNGRFPARRVQYGGVTMVWGEVVQVPGRRVCHQRFLCLLDPVVCNLTFFVCACFCLIDLRALVLYFLFIIMLCFSSIFKTFLKEREERER